MQRGFELQIDNPKQKQRVEKQEAETELTWQTIVPRRIPAISGEKQITLKSSVRVPFGELRWESTFWLSMLPSELRCR